MCDGGDRYWPTKKAYEVLGLSMPPPQRMIHLRIFGEPRPQGSLRAFNVGGRAVVSQGGSTDGRRKLGDWRTAIGAQAALYCAKHDMTPLDEPVGIVLTFWLTKPKSAPKWKWLPDKRPDLDKLLRGALDALTATILRDDALVVDLCARKRYAIDEAPGADIRIFPAGELERNAEHSGLLVALP